MKQNVDENYQKTWALGLRNNKDNMMMSFLKRQEQFYIKMIFKKQLEMDMAEPRMIKDKSDCKIKKKHQTKK